MNERMRELLEQAGVKFVVMPKDTEYEKFAELIVQEMLVTCEEHPAWTGRMIAEQIKQHFGVKE
jgi:CTP synthase (UTP-ammonia lyase)